MEPLRRLLLATDLSARSDRAEERAVLLTKRCEAELVVLHVLEAIAETGWSPWVRPGAEAAERARRDLDDELREARGRVALRVEEGDPAQVIVRLAREERCALVVTGVARNETLGRFTLGKTVEQVLRTSEVPVLVVTARARAPYQRIIVAVDFSEVSSRALATALAWFPGQRLTVFHAHGAPASYAASNVSSHREQFRQVALTDFERFLDGAGLSADDRARIDVEVEWGEPGQRVLELVQRGAADLVVLGTRGRGRLLELFVSSIAKRIVVSLPCDALVVPG